MTSSHRAWLRRLILWPILTALAFFLMLRWFENSQVFHPSRSRDATGHELGRPFEDLHFTAADGTRLHAWFYPADTNSPRKDLVILLCHGNGGNITHRLGSARALLAAGVNVFLLEYRGYGRSEGRPSEAGTYLDAHAAYEWLRARGFAPRAIIPMGESLGGGVASELSVSAETGGLILQSTFTSIPDIGAELFPWLPVRHMARIRYDTLSRLPQIHVPVLVMHSRSDGLIHFHHAEKNFAAANEPKLLWEISGRHNDGIVDLLRFQEGLEKFFALKKNMK